jgi:hypothetical protein
MRYSNETPVFRERRAFVALFESNLPNIPTRGQRRLMPREAAKRAVAIGQRYKNFRPV